MRRPRVFVSRVSAPDPASCRALVRSLPPLELARRFPVLPCAAGRGGSGSLYGHNKQHGQGSGVSPQMQQDQSPPVYFPHGRTPADLQRLGHGADASIGEHLHHQQHDCGALKLEENLSYMDPHSEMRGLERAGVSPSAAAQQSRTIGHEDRRYPSSSCFRQENPCRNLVRPRNGAPGQYSSEVKESVDGCGGNCFAPPRSPSSERRGGSGVAPASRSGGPAPRQQLPFERGSLAASPSVETSRLPSPFPLVSVGHDDTMQDGSERLLGLGGRNRFGFQGQDEAKELSVAAHEEAEGGNRGGVLAADPTTRALHASLTRCTSARDEDGADKHHQVVSNRSFPGCQDDVEAGDCATAQQTSARMLREIHQQGSEGSDEVMGDEGSADTRRIEVLGEQPVHGSGRFKSRSHGHQRYLQQKQACGDVHSAWSGFQSNDSKKVDHVNATRNVRSYTDPNDVLSLNSISHQHQQQHQQLVQLQEKQEQHIGYEMQQNDLQDMGQGTNMQRDSDGFQPPLLPTGHPSQPPVWGRNPTRLDSGEARHSKNFVYNNYNQSHVQAAEPSNHKLSANSKQRKIVPTTLRSAQVSLHPRSTSPPDRNQRSLPQHGQRPHQQDRDDCRPHQHQREGRDQHHQRCAAHMFASVSTSDGESGGCASQRDAGRKRDYVQATLVPGKAGYCAELGPEARRRRVAQHWAGTPLPVCSELSLLDSRPQGSNRSLPSGGAQYSTLGERQSTVDEFLVSPNTRPILLPEEMPLSARLAALRSGAATPHKSSVSVSSRSSSQEISTTGNRSQSPVCSSPATATHPHPSGHSRDVLVPARSARATAGGSPFPQPSSHVLPDLGLGYDDDRSMEQSAGLEAAGRCGQRARGRCRAATATETGEDWTRLLGPTSEGNRRANAKNKCVSGKSKSKKEKAATGTTERAIESVLCGPQDPVVDISTREAAQEFLGRCRQSEGCCIGLLYSDESQQQYCSTLRPLSADQLKALKKHAKLANNSDAEGALAPETFESFATVLQGVGISLLGEDHSTLYWIRAAQNLKSGTLHAPRARLSSLAVELLSSLLCNKRHQPNWVPPVCFNAKAVIRDLALGGVSLPETEVTAVDARLLAWLLQPEHAPQEGVEQLAQEVAPELNDIQTHQRPEGGYTALNQLRVDLHQSGALGDVLVEKSHQCLDQFQLETRVVPLLAHLEMQGIGFLPKVLELPRASIWERLNQLQQQATELMGGEPFNLASNQQVANALYETLALPRPSNFQQGSTKQLTTKDEVLQQLIKHHPLPELILEFRALSKILGCYIEPLLRKAKAQSDGSFRLFCNWHNTRTATGRLSTSNPNMQAIPKYVLKGSAPDGTTTEINIRSAFVASQGSTLVACDYSQIELRLLAHVCKDQNLVGILQKSGNEGGDMFEFMWNRFQEMPENSPVVKADREKAKRTIYGIIYGQGIQGLASKLNISQTAAKDLIQKLYTHFPGIKTFIKETKERAYMQQNTASVSGRLRPLPNIRSADARLRSEAERQAVNTVIQGSAADLIKLAMLKWCEALASDRVRLVAQIHDELLVECPCEQAAEVAQKTRSIMAGIQDLVVPLVVNVQMGESWGTMKPMLI